MRSNFLLSFNRRTAKSYMATQARSQHRKVMSSFQSPHRERSPCNIAVDALDLLYPVLSIA
jgi:hypothetical protein